MVNKIGELCDLIKFHNNEYREGNPQITDEAFDRLVDELKNLDPTNDYFKKGVQDEQPKSRKQILPYQMYSLDKCKNLDEIKEWLSNKNIELIITPKLDGLSIQKDLVSQKAWTRGDGKVGQNCSEHVVSIKGPQLECDKKDFSIFVRGEVIFLNERWDKFKEKNPEYKNSRNTATGLINGNFDPNKPYNEMTYLCYDVLGQNLSKEEQLNWLNKLTSVPIPYTKITTEKLNEKQLENLFLLWSKDFPIDGLVIDINDSKYRTGQEANGNPSYARAYKHKNFSEKAQTVIQTIERNVNRYGTITPVCVIKPVNIAGVEVTRVNGINMSYLYDWGMMPGTEIIVMRSGEVIPKIVAVEGIEIPFREDFKTNKEYVVKYETQQGIRVTDLDSKGRGNQIESFMDETCFCPFCQSPLVWDKTLTNMVCQNQDCEEINIQKLSDFFKICGVEEFKETTFRQLYKKGWKTPAQVLNIHVIQLESLEGWGKSSAWSFVGEMDKLKFEGIPFAKFCHATGLFEGIGEKTIQLILDNINLEDWIKGDTISIDDLTKIHGVAEITAKIFLEGSEKIWSNEMSPYTLVKFAYTQSPLPKAGILNGAIVVFSGFRDTILAAELEDKGAIVEDNFTKKTNLLIVKDKSQTTSKMKKAEEQGTAVYTREELINKLKTM